MEARKNTSPASREAMRRKTNARRPENHAQVIRIPAPWPRRHKVLPLDEPGLCSSLNRHPLAASAHRGGFPVDAPRGSPRDQLRGSDQEGNTGEVASRYSEGEITELDGISVNYETGAHARSA